MRGEELLNRPEWAKKQREVGTIPPCPAKCQGLNVSKIKAILDGSAGKESACNIGDAGSIPVLGRSPGKHSNSLQYS